MTSQKTEAPDITRQAIQNALAAPAEAYSDELAGAARFCAELLSALTGDEEETGKSLKPVLPPASASREAVLAWLEKRPLHRVLTRLWRYGSRGAYSETYGTAAPPPENPALQADLARARALTDLLAGLQGEAAGNCARVFWTALARRRLDAGEKLLLEELALLTGMVLRAVQNATQARLGEKRLLVGDDGHVEHAHAVAWLGGRRGFMPTQMDQDAAGETDAEVEEEDFLFVPESADGTLFLPDCRTPGGFVTGPKGRQKKFQDYLLALRHLQRMATPRWRRPNPSGNWGVVSGVRWVRLRRRDFEEMKSTNRKGGEAPDIPGWGQF